MPGLSLLLGAVAGGIMTVGAAFKEVPTEHVAVIRAESCVRDIVEGISDPGSNDTMSRLARSEVEDTLLRVTERSYSELIAKHKGKVVLVNFWATWCSPCLEELPKLIALEAKLASKGIQLITISADEPEQDTVAIKFLNSVKAPHPRYLKDANDNDAFINGIDSSWSGALPALFIYDRDGKLARKFIGEHEFEKIKAAVTKLVSDSLKK